MPWLECLSCSKDYFVNKGWLTRDEERVLARQKCKHCGYIGAKLGVSL